MVKLLSTVLSFLLIFGSVVPSLAQVQQQNARETERLKSHIYSTATKAQADQTQAVVSPTLKKIEMRRATNDANFVRVTREEAGVLERANQVLENLRSAAETASEDNGPLTWPEFEAIYRPQLEQGGTLAEMLKGRSEEEAKLIREKYEEALNAMVHEAYVKYQQNYAQWLKEKEKEYKEELKQLSNEAVGVTNFIMYGYRDGVQGNPAKRSVDPISVFLPTMYTAFGKDVVTDQTRKKAVEVLRARIQKSMDGAGSQSLLQNTHALAVLGMDLRDAQLVSEVLIKHANEAGVAPAFIQVLGADLAGMKDIAPDYQPLAAVLLNLQSKEGNRSVWEVTPLKISNWVKGIHGLVGGVEFATKDYINSIYKDPEARCGEGEHKRPCANSRSAWLDLGTELGEIAREDEAMRAMLNRVVNELVMVRAGEKEPQIMTSNNLFLTGLLGTGFKVSLKGNGVRDILTQQGTVVTLASEEQEVAKAVEEIKALGLTQSEYLAFLLYHQSYEDIEPATARYIRNVLYAAITTSQKAERLGMHTLDNPSREEVENYEKWNKWITETAILDRVLGFVAEFIIMVLTWEVAFLTVGRFVRFGGSLLHAVRLSTLTARAGEGAANIEAIGRLMKIAARNSSTRVPLQVVRTGEAARASQVLEETVQAEVKKSIGKNLFTHNGITYFVPKGFRNVLVNVNGRWSVQVVEEGLSRAEIARRFAVAQDAVAEIMVVNGRAVGNAAKLLEELKSGLNYTAGAAGVNEGTTVSVGVGARVSGAGLKSMPVPAAAEATEGASTAATAANQGAQVVKQGKGFWEWLDETVIHWRPINSATPSFARQSWDSFNYWLRIQVPDFLKGVGQLGTSRYGVGALGSGVSPMYAGTAAINNSTAIVAEAQAARSAVQVSEVAASAVGETSAAAATATTATTAPIANRSLFNILKAAMNAGMKKVAPAVFALAPWWAPENEQQTPLQVNIDNAYQQWMRKEEDYVTSQLRDRLQQSAAQTAPMAFVVTESDVQTTPEDEPIVASAQGAATQETAGDVTTPVTLSQQTSGVAASWIIPPFFPGADKLMEKLTGAGASSDTGAKPAVDEATTNLVIQKAIAQAREELKAHEIQNNSVYASLLASTIRRALEDSNITLNDPSTIYAVNFALLAELPDDHLLRQQTVDAITGRKLSFIQQVGRYLATKLTGRMVALKPEDLEKVEQAVLQTIVEDNLRIDYDQLKQAVQQGVTLVDSTTDGFVEDDGNGNQVEFSYKKEVHDYSRLLSQLAPAALRFDSQSGQLGFRPRMLKTGVEGFPYLYTSILLKTRERDANGRTTGRKNIYTVVLSDDDSIFKKLKEGWYLVVDTYGNVYKTDGKTRVTIFDRKVSVVHLAGLENMPVVVLQKTKDRLRALNLTYSVMGFSSTGRFLNTSLSDQYGGILGANAASLGTGISTGVYLTNIAPLIPGIGLQKQVQKHGGKAVLKALMPVSLITFAWATLANIFGADPHGWSTLVPVIASIFASGITSAAIQQNANPAAKQMLRGKPADDLVAGGQLFKTIGSMGAYLAYALAVILTGKWQMMYALLAIPTLLSLFSVWTTDLPLPQAKKSVATNVSNTKDETADNGARNKLQKFFTSPNWKFFLDPKIGLLFAGLFVFCGSETQASTATKSILTGLINSIAALKPAFAAMAHFFQSTLPWMSDVSPEIMADAIGTLVTGIFTMGPVFFGRLAAKSLLAKVKGVDKANQKLLLTSAVATLGLMTAMYTVGPQAGLWLLPLVVGVNALLGNMFTFSFNIMKEHDKKKYHDAFSTLTGSLSTAAVVGCWAIPTLISKLITAPAGVEVTTAVKQQLAFDQLIVPISLIIGAVLINYRHFANPFNWKSFSKEDLANMQEKVVSQFKIFRSAEDRDALLAELAEKQQDVPIEEISAQIEKHLARLKTEMAAAMGISEAELDGLLAGTSDKKLSEEALTKALAVLNLSFKKFSKNPEKNANLILDGIYNRLMLQVNASLEKNKNDQENNDDPLGGAGLTQASAH